MIQLKYMNLKGRFGKPIEDKRSMVVQLYNNIYSELKFFAFIINLYHYTNNRKSNRIQGLSIDVIIYQTRKTQ